MLINHRLISHFRSANWQAFSCTYLDSSVWSFWFSENVVSEYVCKFIVLLSYQHIHSPCHLRPLNHFKLIFVHLLHIWHRFRPKHRIIRIRLFLKHFRLVPIDMKSSNWELVVEALLLLDVMLFECLRSLFVIVHQNMKIDQVKTLDNAIWKFNDHLLMQLAKLRELKQHCLVPTQFLVVLFYFWWKLTQMKSLKTDHFKQFKISVFCRVDIEINWIFTFNWVFG